MKPGHAGCRSHGPARRMRGLAHRAGADGDTPGSILNSLLTGGLYNCARLAVALAASYPTFRESAAVSRAGAPALLPDSGSRVHPKGATLFSTPPRSKLREQGLIRGHIGRSPVGDAPAACHPL